MAGADQQWSANFGTAAAEAVRVYDEVLVPRMFLPWAGALLDDLAVTGGEAVLDVACGPGTVTRVAAERVGAGGRVVGCDLSPAMLARAAARAAGDDDVAIELRQGPAEALPVADGEFDVATCQHGLQFFPDRPAALAEVHRALKPGGRLGLAVWTAVDRSPPFLAVADAIGGALGPDARARYVGGPWALPDAATLATLAIAGGFQGIRVDTQVRPVSFDDAAQLVSTVVVSPLGAELAAAGVYEQVVEAVAATLGDGPISSTLEANVLVARR